MLDAKTLKQRLVSSDLATPETLVPVSLDELNELENSVGVKIPNDYRDFLLEVGKCAGVFMDDCDFFFPEIKGLNENAKKMLAAYEGSKLELPDGAFVFLDRREQFLFFYGNVDNGGKVYRYLEESGVFEEWASSFWQFIEDELQEAEDLARRHTEASFWKDARERAILRARNA